MPPGQSLLSRAPSYTPHQTMHHFMPLVAQPTARKLESHGPPVKRHKHAVQLHCHFHFSIHQSTGITTNGGPAVAPHQGHRAAEDLPLGAGTGSQRFTSWHSASSASSISSAVSMSIQGEHYGVGYTGFTLVHFLVQYFVSLSSSFNVDTGGTVWRGSLISFFSHGMHTTISVYISSKYVKDAFKPCRVTSPL